MKHDTRLHVLVTMVAALVAAVSIAEVSHALPGPAPTNTAIAEYFPSTGVIIVSADQVGNWYVESLSESMTGLLDPPALPHDAGIVTDNVKRIGEWVPGGDFSFTNLDLGVVTLADLAAGDLSIWYNAAGWGSPLLGPFEVIGNGGGGPAGPDYDSDGDVDGQDFLLWQRDDASASGLAAWQDRFGETTPAVASLSAVPEPSSLLMIVLGGLALAATARRRG